MSVEKNPTPNPADRPRSAKPATPASRPVLSTVIALLTLAAAGAAAAQSWSSDRVWRDASGRLVYTSDPAGNSIPDFSHAGYGGGGVPLPRVPAVETVSAGPGDDTAVIQAALDRAAALAPDAEGFRGAVELAAGRYEIWGTLYLDASGVVLRGAGDGADPAADTILWARGNTPQQRPVIVAGGGTPAGTAWPGEVSGTRTDVVTPWVPVGARSFEVADASAFEAGDNVILVHPSTQSWIDAVGGGGTATDPSWSAGDVDIVYNRRIAAVDGNGVILDGPVFNHLDRSLSQSYLYLHDRSDIRTRIGIESLRIDIETSGAADDENHAWDAIRLEEIEDAWVLDVTALHFGRSAVRTWQANRVTVRDVQALDPVSVITGSRRYSFNTYRASNDILFDDCHATDARHAYVSNGTSSASGIVFLDSTSFGDHKASEGHRWWSQGLLYDRCTFSSPNTSGRQLGLYNRGAWGTGHGWSAAHSVAWNTLVDTTLVVQQPPTAQNYAIGCFGTVTGKDTWLDAAGHIEGSNRGGLDPDSLYQAQLGERLAYGPPPSQPAGLVVDTANPFALTWIDVAQAETGYRIERSDDGGATWSPVAETPPDATSYSAAGPDLAMFRVQAMGANGASTWSNTACYDPDGDGVCDAAGGGDVCPLDASDDVDMDGFCPSDGDCVDTDPAINPDATEICTDGIDNDCDGKVDAADGDCALCLVTNSKEKGPRCRDGRDNDCDGLIDALDPDCR